MINNNKSNEINDHVISHVIMENEIQQQLIDMYTKELSSLPEGGLYQKAVNGKKYLYQFINTKGNDKRNYTKQIAIRENKYKLAAALKRKHFINKSLPLLRNNVKFMKAFLNKYVQFDPSKIEKELPEVYKDLPQICFHNTSDNVYVSEWIEESYNKNTYNTEALIHSTVNGLKVRSKSEAIIAGLLESNNIPFRYEAELKVGIHKYYPDFTIFNPKDGEIIYWEHFGMIDNTGYNLSMEQKMMAYKTYDIYPWDNLITTYDKRNGSIDAHKILNIIKAFILL